MLMIRIIRDLLLLAGAYFTLAGTIGLLRMPDTLCRMQATTCTSTMGVLCICLGGVVHAIFIMGSASVAVKLLVIALLTLITNPVGAHRLAIASYMVSTPEERKLKIDEWGRDISE